MKFESKREGCQSGSKVQAVTKTSTPLFEELESTASRLRSYQFQWERGPGDIFSWSRDAILRGVGQARSSNYTEQSSGSPRDKRLVSFVGFD